MLSDSYTKKVIEAEKCISVFMAYHRHVM